MSNSTEKAQYNNFNTYTAENHYKNTKESFKRLANLVLDSRYALSEKSRILDAGCATGALVHYLRQTLACEYVGVDISEKLLSIAKVNMPEYEWRTGSVLELPEEYKSLFDVSLCIGTLGIFDEEDAKKAISELIRCTKSGGRIYLFAQFNEWDVDVLVTHRKSTDGYMGSWEKGWNIYSIMTIREWLREKVSSVNIIDYSMPFELPRQEDPVRTWTFQDADGGIRLTNGLKLLVDLKFIEIVV